jgi:hypothetical protein
MKSPQEFDSAMKSPQEFDSAMTPHRGNSAMNRRANRNGPLRRLQMQRRNESA